MSKNLFVISVGGSLIVPDKIDVRFLKAFKRLILRQTKKGKRFVIMCGGGKTARNYQAVASSLAKLRDWDVDYLGIHATRINAHLVRTIFYKWAHPKVIQNPTEKVNFKEKILVAAGWKPGASTDYDAVLIAKNLKAKKLVNLTNIDYVYNKDPKKFKNSRPIKQISWKEFRKMFPKKWDPGLNVPFDPIASREAERLKMEVVIINGRKIKNLERYLKGKNFIGTKIRG